MLFSRCSFLGCELWVKVHEVTGRWMSDYIVDSDCHPWRICLLCSELPMYCSYLRWCVLQSAFVFAHVGWTLSCLYLTGWVLEGRVCDLLILTDLQGHLQGQQGEIVVFSVCSFLAYNFSLLWQNAWQGQHKERKFYFSSHFENKVHHVW